MKVLPLLLLAYLGSCVSAQAATPQRLATALKVVDSAGERAVGVALQCFAEPWCGDVDGHSDLVVGETDEGGRVVVRLLPGRKYSVAASMGFEKGLAATCAEADSLVAGTARTLQLDVIQPLDLRPLTGLHHWQELGPLTVEVSPLASGSFFVPLQEHGTLRAKRIRVVDQDRAPIWECAAADALAAGMPPPHEVRVQVNLERGGPAAQVEIWQRTPANPREAESLLQPSRRDVWRLLGRTGDQGQATVRIAVRARGNKVEEPLLLEARKPGRVPAIAGFLAWHTAFHDHVAVAATAEHVLQFTLRHQTPVKIVPPASYRMTIWGRGNGGQVSPAEGPLTLRTSSDGESSLPVQPNGNYTRIVRIEHAQQEPIWSLLDLGVGVCEVPFAAKIVDVAVRDEFGNPLRQGSVYMAAMSTDQEIRMSTCMPLRLDRAGRCRLRLASNAHWVFWARRGDFIAWHAVADADVAGKAVVLDLRPVPCATVRVLGDAGAPLLGGEQVSCGGTMRLTMRGTPEASFLPHLQWELDRSRASRLTLDPYGEFSVPLLPGISRVITIMHPSRGQSTPAALVAGEVVELTLR